MKKVINRFSVHLNELMNSRKKCENNDLESNNGFQEEAANNLEELDEINDEFNPTTSSSDRVTKLHEFIRQIIFTCDNFEQVKRSN